MGRDVFRDPIRPAAWGSSHTLRQPRFLALSPGCSGTGCQVLLPLWSPTSSSFPALLLPTPTLSEPPVGALRTHLVAHLSLSVRHVWLPALPPAHATIIASTIGSTQWLPVAAKNACWPIEKHSALPGGENEIQAMPRQVPQPLVTCIFSPRDIVHASRRTTRHRPPPARTHFVPGNAVSPHTHESPPARGVAQLCTKCSHTPCQLCWLFQMLGHGHHLGAPPATTTFRQAGGLEVAHHSEDTLANNFCSPSPTHSQSPQQQPCLWHTRG